MRVSIPAILLLLVVSPHLQAAGHAFSENFSVLTPAEDKAESFANEVLEAAEFYRKAIAEQWLGEELPAGVGRTLINVCFSGEDSGMTWAVDSKQRRYHRLFMSTSRERAVGNTLAHEMCHVILATRFPHPNRLPAWIEEGIASRYDDNDRIAKRQQIVEWYSRTGNWPNLEQILGANAIPCTDQSAYATAASITEFLLSRGDRQKLLTFAQQTVTENLERALRRHYNFRNVGELEIAWQAWIRSQNQIAHRL